MDAPMVIAGPIETSPTIGKLAAALAKAQGKIEGAKKDKVNPHFKSKYADLAAVWDACREPLSENELAVIQLPVSSPDMVGISTTLAHSSGEFIRGSVWTKPQQPGPQALGSVVSYLRRYALAAAAGVAPDDDDGESAQGRGAEGKADGADARDRPPAKRADKVPAQPQAKKATPEQVKRIHTLKTKTGTDDEAYRRGLSAYKNANGQPVTTSKDLTEEQASNLIQRLENLDARKQQALAGMQAQEGENLKAALGRPANGNGSDDATLRAALQKKELTEQEVCSYFGGADKFDDLTRDEKAVALSMVLAYGTPQYERILEQKFGVVSP